MKISFADEQQLLRRAQDGDAGAFEELVAAFTPELFRVVRRMTADTDTAEAILQETFWRVWQALARYQFERRFFPYLAAIAANLVRDSWRKDRRLLPDELDLLSEIPDDKPGPEFQMEEHQALQSLAREVEALPARQRAVIALRYDAGLSYEMIASALDLPLNTVRTILHRAKQTLRQKLEAGDA
jgi:RNA polymerase sigma-70 factor, ECF subfamily